MCKFRNYDICGSYGLISKKTTAAAVADRRPESFTMRGELRWGRLERVYDPHRDPPEFVRGEYIVRGETSPACWTTGTQNGEASYSSGEDKE